MCEMAIECNSVRLDWNRKARDLDVLSDRALLEELCRRVVDYHATSLKFHDCERGTANELLENDNNYCRVREVVQHVIGIDLEYVEEVKDWPGKIVGVCDNKVRSESYEIDSARRIEKFVQIKRRK